MVVFPTDLTEVRLFAVEKVQPRNYVLGLEKIVSGVTEIRMAGVRDQR